MRPKHPPLLVFQSSFPLKWMQFVMNSFTYYHTYELFCCWSSRLLSSSSLGRFYYPQRPFGRAVAAVQQVSCLPLYLPSLLSRVYTGLGLIIQRSPYYLVYCGRRFPPKLSPTHVSSVGEKKCPTVHFYIFLVPSRDSMPDATSSTVTEGDPANCLRYTWCLVHAGRPGCSNG